MRISGLGCCSRGLIRSIAANQRFFFLLGFAATTHSHVVHAPYKNPIFCMAKSPINFGAPQQHSKAEFPPKNSNRASRPLYLCLYLTLGIIALLSALLDQFETRIFVWCASRGSVASPS